MKLLLIDFYDSFSYNLQDYFAQLGAKCILKRCDEVSIEDIETFKPEGIVLSPGPGLPSDYTIIHKVLSLYKDRTPILGICLGHQAIGEFYGLKLSKASQPVHGKASTCHHKRSSVFRSLEEPLKVMRYHSLILSGTSNEMQILAWTEDKSIMAIEHLELPLLGFQFHPESILSPFGLKLLSNWMEDAVAWNSSKNRERMLITD